MPREPRILGSDIHYHIIVRCNNKERLLGDKADFERLLELLTETQKKFWFRLYNYDFLNSHIHLMLSTHGDNFVDKIMHSICFKFAKDFNKYHGRSGHVWGHRYRSRIIANEKHALACLRYQNRNALSLGLVSKPEDWPWSGYSFYAFGTKNHLLTPHPTYLALHENELNRRVAYQKLVNTPIPSDKILYLLEKGNEKTTKRFCTMVEQTNRLQRKITTWCQAPGESFKGRLKSPSAWPRIPSW